jgi:nitrogen PTS system EIIA component
MQIVDFLSQESVSIDLKGASKDEAISELVQLLASTGALNDTESALQALQEREKMGSTGIGHGIAIPHAKSEGVDRILAAYGYSKAGIDFNAIDNQPVHIVFLLIAPPDCAGAHIKALARISRFLKNEESRKELASAGKAEDVIELITKEDHAD